MDVPIVPATKPQPALSSAEFLASQRNVIIGDGTNTTATNDLLSDLVALHRQLGNVQEDTLDDVSRRLVKLVNDGVEGVRCLRGKGVFVLISDDSSLVASEEDALRFVRAILEKEMNSVIENFQEEETCMDIEIPDQASSEDVLEKATDDITRPDEYDVEIGVDFLSIGNARFQDYVNNCIRDDKVAISTPPFSRAKATIQSLWRTKSVPNRAQFARFMCRNDNDTWTVLDETEAAEFVMCYIVDTLRYQVPLSTFATAFDLKSLIPSIGIADLSQFDEFSKPSTMPVRDPTEYDVLFGRGGMTNSHPGNKRFRDIISLHRPDYVRAIKIEKPNVARRIVAAIRGGDPPGRFMKRHPTNLMWYDVGNRHATEKTSQALRERSQAEKNRMVAGMSEPGVRKRLLEQAISEARATRIRLSEEGGSQIVNSLDPTSFKLLLPLHDVPTEPQAEIDGANQVKSDQPIVDTRNMVKVECKQSVAEVVIGNTSLLQDPESEMKADDIEVIGPSSTIGLVDENGDIVVTENDILCGRGGLTNKHRGNKRFRDVVALHRPDYVSATKINKPAVARMIVKAIRNSDPPGRFLRKDSATDKWADIGDKRAAEKASQALRERQSEERTQIQQVAKTVSPSSPTDKINHASSTIGGDSKELSDSERALIEKQNGSSNSDGNNGEHRETVEDGGNNGMFSVVKI